jgi:hypothetical protein
LRQLGVNPNDYRHRFGPTRPDNHVTKAAKDLERARFGSDPYFEFDEIIHNYTQDK